MIHYLPIILEMFQNKYPLVNMENLFFRFCTAPDSSMISIGSKDSIAYWSLAAAIWILDELRESEKLQELELSDYRHPDNFTVQMPEVIDFVHPPELLRSMVTLVQMQMMDVKNGRLLFHSENALFGTKNENRTLNPHKDFLAVINLLNRDHVQYAVDMVKQKIWEEFTIYFKCMKKMVMMSTGELQMKSEIEPSCEEISVAIHLDKCSYEIPIDIQNLKSREELRKKEYHNSVSEELAEFCENFTMEDPYAVCFAIFYLIAVGDDLAWLYVPLIPILNQCWNMLPWKFCVKETDEMDNSDDENDEDVSINIDLGKISLDQWAFAMSGTLFPRNIALCYEFAETLKKKGLPEDIATLYSYYAIFGDIFHEYITTQMEVHQQELERIRHTELGTR